MKTQIGFGPACFAFCLLACQSAPSSNAEGPMRFERPASLDAAHTAYLESDFLTMALQIRKVLTEPNADLVVRDNAFELLEKAYDVRGGRLPADWSLPPGFESMSYKQIRRSDPDGLRYEINLSGRVDDVSRIEALELRRGDEILLDRLNLRGTFDFSRDDDSLVYFALESGDLDALPAPGLLTFHMTLTDGTEVNGWFPVDRLVSSETPRIFTPAAGYAIYGPHPTIRWEAFRSPEFNRFETRTLSIWLSRRQDDGQYGSPWSLWTSNPGDRNEIAVGSPGEPGPEVSLSGGDYHVSITYGELRQFGPMRLVRASRRNQPFHLVD